MRVTRHRRDRHIIVNIACGVAFARTRAIWADLNAGHLEARLEGAEGEERERLWNELEAIYPPYADYQKNAGETDPLAMLRRLELSIDDMAKVVHRAHARGIHAIVTVFSVELVEVAERLEWDAYKSASPDIINRPLLEAMANTGKPLIVSTGASELGEVTRAAGWLEGIRDRLAFLQCVSSYPAPDEALGGIRAIADATGLVTGYSDHTASHRTGSLATMAGAHLLEKHITDDRKRAGPDHAASLLLAQLEQYVQLARNGATVQEDFAKFIDRFVIAMRGADFKPHHLAE